jgi:2,4-dienoyl-CoA reductase-like NADH-dependent reductase (Old Yellow Enzyme family)/thioredoxin reductase
MSDEYDLLFSPIDIGPVTLANRVYHSPVTLNLVDRDTGYPREELADYYGERAKSGLGLIIQGAMDVASASESWPVLNSRMQDDGIIPSARRIVERVHDHGGKIFVELFHVGQASNTRRYARPSVAPSGIPSLVAGTTPKAMEPADIEAAIEGFRRAAVNSRQAGYDGVELHVTHGYLLEQFLSPFFNKRTDEYGGSLENRMRLLMQVIETCREAVGPELALGLRLIGDELLPGGLTLDDSVEIAEIVAATGKVDFFDIDIGSHQNYHITMSPMYGAPSYNLPFSAGIREVVDPLPVLCAPGQLVDPDTAEKVLSEGHADLVGLGRALISDPEWLLKVREGRAEDIRQCVFCNQYTMGNLFKGLPVSCIQNPAVGREKVWGKGTLQRAGRSKKVAIVGGGTAGMEVARLAGLRGHDVTLYEKSDLLGGQVLLAAALPRRSEIEGVVRWLRMQLEKTETKIVLGTEVTPDKLAQLGADAIVIATGAGFLRTGISGVIPEAIPGWDLDGVTVTPEMVLRQEVEIGARVVIVDSDGGVIAPSLAELLAARGKRVSIITSYPMVGPKLVEEMNLPYVYQKLVELDVESLPNSWIGEIRRGEVELFNLYSPTETKCIAADTVVMVTARSPIDELYFSLKDQVGELYRVGDCVAPGDIGTAMIDARRLGTSL